MPAAPPLSDPLTVLPGGEMQAPAAAAHKPAQRWLTRVYWALIALSLLLAGAYAMSTWNGQRQILLNSLDTSSSFLVSATQSYLRSFAAVARVAASDLRANPDLLQRPQALQTLLERDLALLPDANALSVIGADGRLLGSSLTGANLADADAAARLMQALKSGAKPPADGLVVGRPIYCQRLQAWTIPMLYPVAATAQSPAFDLVLTISTEALLKHTMMGQFLPYPGTAAVLARQDGYVIARTPPPTNPRFYGQPQSGAFLTSLRQNPQAQHAHYSGNVTADGKTRIGTWQRLQTHPDLAAAVSVPAAVLTGQYLRTIWPPMLGLLVFLVVLSALYAYVHLQLRREASLDRAQRLQLQLQALSDPLTGVGNRALLWQQLESALRQASRSGGRFALLLLDLDGFKQVNDSYGHSAGDALLREATQRFWRVLLEHETLARMGGDEFAVLLLGTPRDVAETEAVAHKLLQVLRTPFDLGNGRQATLSGSIGAALYPEDGADAETLLRRADLALYAAKAAGRDRYLRFAPEFEREAQRRKEMVDWVEKALQDDRLYLVYQPIVAIGGDPERPAVVGVEALLRLRHPERGEMSAAAFAAALDHGRLARPIGRFVFERALAQGAAWHAQGLKLHIAVNVSAEHLLQPDFLADLRQALAAQPAFPASSLVLEVTESAPLRNLPQAREVLQACQDLGLMVALDDFGTGAASLTYLQQLPAQSIKIDQSFVRDMVNDPKDFAIVSAVVTAANLLGLEVIGEGAESLDHLAMLAAMGCTLAQGYAIARPLPADSIPAWVQTWQRPQVHLRAAAFPREVEAAQQRRVERIQLALRGQAPFPDHVLDLAAENQCHLGLWLHGQGRLYYGRDPRYSLLLEQHAHIHELARQAKAAFDAGQREHAQRLGAELAALSERIMEGIRALSREAQPDAARQSGLFTGLVRDLR